MQVEFKNRNLQCLYTEGRNRKYNLQQEVIKKFFMRVQQLEAANDIYDLWKTPSVNFEKLKGFENKYSLKVDKGYRLEIEIAWENKEKTKGSIYIIELSKHYGD